MAELTQEDKLQPSLLDRLTDEEPEKAVEARQRRVITLQRLRECVLRDLGWLLNTGNMAQTEDLESFPYVSESVLNYGTPDLAGTTISGSDVPTIERALRKAILDFEPRIIRKSLKIRVVTSPDQMSHNAMTFVIAGEMWAQPIPLELFLKTEIDLETGSVQVTEHFE